ncbi:hypothetical protein OS493_017246 [Desmophyllum pertusum]|uniref:Uncharacterized protein n=1 Tax=Desmophyllum pertusum TaxID=174260 RepID=A0A9X0A146_9CNID|nr:hypothetical protein OS493_017246 [Desmophyllum pertusum]
MRAIKSIVLLQALLGIIAIGQQMEQGDGRKIIIILTGNRVAEPKTKPDTTANFKQSEQKKERWLKHWSRTTKIRTKKADNARSNRTGGHFDNARRDKI